MTDTIEGKESSGRGRFGRRLRSLRGQELAQTAGRLLLENGCSQVRMEDVARECGVAKGTCYRHYKGRSELLSAAVSELDNAFAAHLSSLAATRRDPHAAIKAAVAAVSRGLERLLPRRIVRAASRSGLAWPCCLSHTVCPHAGPVSSLKLLTRTVAEAHSGSEEAAGLAVALTLAVPVVLMRKNGRGKRAGNRTIFTRALSTLKQLTAAAVP